MATRKKRIERADRPVKAQVCCECGAWPAPFRKAHKVHFCSDCNKQRK